MTDFDTLTAILTRRASCRGFRPDPVPQAEIAAVLSSAQHVPSWCNSQPWQVIACGAEQTDRLRSAFYDHASKAAHASDIPFPSGYDGACRDRRRDCGWQLYEAVGVTKGDREGSARQMMENFRFFGAPNFLLITTPKILGPYGVLDCGAFVTAVLLGLEARGLAGIAMASVAGFSPFLRDWFGIAEDRDILCGIALGYRDEDHPANGFRTTRAGLSDVVDWR
ncbi:nitroreductase [Mesobacterium sp. TK19101]|uniref:Nitroreductase n=1 Tax=Mesobacterium hydrothermale TaxID=3111907 RepID=A0ABU6HHH5_9RHOB|nr:nitroreductase [Mesobacterium sp. TK19101]MEC3861862.1 nitroreductase [Mesobacterium sp. TK19101]